MAITRVYRKAGEGATASYDFTDLASGLGYQTFYGACSKSDGAGTSFALLANILPSMRKETFIVNNGTATLGFNSSPFNLPRTIKGNAFISLGYATISDLGAGTSFAVCLYKYSGTTVSLIATSQALEFLPAGALNISSQALIQMPCTQTIIKKGDYLKLNIYIEAINPGTGTYISLGHDPTGKDGHYIKEASGATTIMKVNIPFKIDI